MRPLRRYYAHRLATDVRWEQDGMPDARRNHNPSKSRGSSDRRRGKRVRPKARRNRSSTSAATRSSSNGMNERTPSSLTMASASLGYRLTRWDSAMDSAIPTAFVDRHRSKARRSWAYVASGSTGRSTSIRRTNSVCAILGSIRFIGGPRGRPRRTKAFAVDYHVNCRESRQVSKFRGPSNPACSRRCGK